MEQLPAHHYNKQTNKQTATHGIYSTLHQLLLMSVFKDKSTYKFTKE